MVANHVQDILQYIWTPYNSPVQSLVRGEEIGCIVLFAAGTATVVLLLLLSMCIYYGALDIVLLCSDRKPHVANHGSDDHHKSWAKRIALSHSKRR